MHCLRSTVILILDLKSKVRIPSLATFSMAINFIKMVMTKINKKEAREILFKTFQLRVGITKIKCFFCIQCSVTRKTVLMCLRVDNHTDYEH